MSTREPKTKTATGSIRGTIAAIGLSLLIVGAISATTGDSPRSAEYDRTQRALASGWNTWNTQSMLSHVLLPEGFALNIGLKRNDFTRESYLSGVLVRRSGHQDETVRIGPHAYNGSYTELTLNWHQLQVRIQSATDGEDLVLLITPLVVNKVPYSVVIGSALLWNRPGSLRQRDDKIVATFQRRTVSVYSTNKNELDVNVPAQTPHFTHALDSTVGVSTGRRRSLTEIRQVVERRRAEHASEAARYGEHAEVYDAMQSVMAWATIYDPRNDRVVSGVSHAWNTSWGGYALFCWDTFFAAYMAAVSNKGLAYANAIEMVREATPDGFVPNYAEGRGRNSFDRSQPPVGSLVALEIYKKYREKWFLRDTFDGLLRWNRWWIAKRLNKGMLSWGSNPFEADWLPDGLAHSLRAAKYESGLDNSPMYDDVPFNKQSNSMELTDVGLMSLYVADCDALAEIARVLGRLHEEKELKNRAQDFRQKLRSLWSESDGIFLNRRTDTGEASKRLSPTNFYPLLARAATKQQAGRMINEHLLNPYEFWGEWVIPSSPRSDPAYKEQNFWRGRVWAPMNLLVYLGLRNYDFPDVRKDLARKSRQLLLKEWREHRHIHENYNGITGEGDDVKNSLRLYHWGALLGLITLIEEGKFFHERERS